MSWVDLHRRLARDEARGLERLAGWLLAPAACLYGAAVGVRNELYDRGVLRGTRLGPAVVVVGALAAGGTGKTPLAADIAMRLNRVSRRPLIIARGYGAIARGGAPRLLRRAQEPPREDARTAGEEALLLAALAADVAVALGADHAAALEAARAGGVDPDVVVIDGGFQHRRVRADLSLVLLDASRPAGQGHLLPRGELRESWRGLRRADLIVLHRAELCADPRGWTRFLETRAPGKPVLWMENVWGCPYAPGVKPRREEAWETLARRRLGVWTAIARPEAFLDALLRRGIVPLWVRARRDHAPCDAAEQERMRAAARAARLEGIVMTEKDAVKLPSGGGGLPEAWVVPSRLVIRPPGEETLERRLRALPGSAPR